MSNFSLSQGLAASLAGGTSMKGAMDGGFIKIYSGTPPDYASDALGSATLLCTVSLNNTGTGLTLTQDGRFLRKPNSDTWSGTNAATGTATFYRHVLTGDTGAASTTDLRMQGSVGLTSAEDMQLIDAGFTSGVLFQLNSYLLAQPLHG